MRISSSSLAAIAGAVAYLGIAAAPVVWANQGAGGDLTLRQALELALAGNPELASYSWDVKSGDARIQQAGLLPNPEIGMEAENILGSGPYRNFDSIETTLSISQLVELGGKRAARIRAAEAEKGVVSWDYEAKRADLVADVARSFVEVLAAQEKVALSEETTRLEEETLSVVSARVEAGKISPVEETKARVALSVGRIGLEKANRALDAARAKLAAAWGGSKPVLFRAVGRLDQVPPVPPFDEFAGRLSRNPDISRWSVEMEQRKAVLAQERAERVPDVVLTAGVRRFSDAESDETAMVFGASVPLPLFNRNQGKILEARYRISKAERDREAAENRVRAALSEAYQMLAIGYTEATTLESVVLPGALNAYESASEGFRQGKFGYLDVLDAQRTLFEARGRQIEALSTYHKAAADVERLIGGALEETVENNRNNGGELK